MIECQICKRQLGTLVGKHLKSHGLSSQEYQEQFPGHPVSAMKPWTEELRSRHKQIRTGRKHSDETKQKIAAGNKGKIMPREAVERQKESYQKFLESNGGSPQRGMKRSAEFRARMKQVAENRSPELVQQKVQQMLAARRGQKMTEAQKAKYSVARLDFIEKNPDKIIPKLFNTKPEQEFEQQLKDRNLAYKKNFRIGNRLFDFAVGDCVVEIDGPYHWNFMMHGNKNMSIEERKDLFSQAQQKDAMKTQLAIDNGYKVFRIKVVGSLPPDWLEILKSQGWDLF